jgi:hypothetical protein
MQTPRLVRVELDADRIHERSTATRREICW